MLTILSSCLLAACGAGNDTTTSSGSATASATLSWSAPLTNTDGSMLADLAGYHVYYGTDPNNLTQVADVTSASQVVFTANNLTAGIWYFTISAYNSAGAEGEYSQTVNTTVG